MVTKTITIKEEAYLLLTRHKFPTESFSDEIIREFGSKKKSILEFAGILSDLTKEQREQFEESREQARKLNRKRRERIMKEFQSDDDSP